MSLGVFRLDGLSGSVANDNGVAQAELGGIAACLPTTSMSWGDYKGKRGTSRGRAMQSNSQRGRQQQKVRIIGVRWGDYGWEPDMQYQTEYRKGCKRR